MNNRLEMVLTALTPLSHHDPNDADGSNMLTFLRRKQAIAAPCSSRPAGQRDMDAFSAAHPVPFTLVPLCETLDFPQFVAVVLVRQFIAMYGAGDGVGLFSGMERYDLLASRLRSSGTRAHTLRGVWDILSRDLQVPIPPSSADAPLLMLFALPAMTQVEAVGALARECNSVIAIARHWQREELRSNESYALAANLDLLREPPAVLHFTAEAMEHHDMTLYLDVPAISANSIRHQVFRAAAWRHLCDALGIDPGALQLPLGVESIFVNGGNIKAGAKQPSGTAYHSKCIRETFPSLDLLGGVTNSFDLGESTLRVAAWLVCAENAGALVGTQAERLPNARISAFDMLDDVTATRQATPRGEGQMIYNFEVLAQGVEIYVVADIDPWAGPLTRGALAAAVATYMGNSAIVGGQSARGYGRVAPTLLAMPDDCDGAIYEKYLADQRRWLLDWMKSGYLGAEIAVCD
jgi:hypothetical protein